MVGVVKSNRSTLFVFFLLCVFVPLWLILLYYLQLLIAVENGLGGLMSAAHSLFF